MNPIFSAADRLQRFFHHRAWAFCFMGGLAVQRWGEPRLTRDVDLTLLVGFGSEESYIDPLLKEFGARVDEPRQFALEHRVLLLRDANGVPLDLALGALPFEERTIDRSSPWAIKEDCRLRTCSAEDLIVQKAFASREQDWMDVVGIVERQQSSALDWELIFRELEELLPLKGDPSILERLRSIRENAIG